MSLIDRSNIPAAVSGAVEEGKSGHFLGSVLKGLKRGPNTSLATELNHRLWHGNVTRDNLPTEIKKVKGNQIFRRQAVVSSTLVLVAYAAGAYGAYQVAILGGAIAGVLAAAGAGVFAGLVHFVVPALVICAVLKAAIVIGEIVGLINPPATLSESQQQSCFYPILRTAQFGQQVFHLLLSPYYLLNGAVKKHADNAFERGRVTYSPGPGSVKQLGGMYEAASQLCREEDASQSNLEEGAPQLRRVDEDASQSGRVSAVTKLSAFFGGGFSRVYLARKLQEATTESQLLSAAPSLSQ